MTKFNEKTSNKKQKLSVILSWETQSLQKEHIFWWPSLSGFDINTVSKAEDLPIEKY